MVNTDRREEERTHTHTQNAILCHPAQKLGECNQAVSPALLRAGERHKMRVAGRQPGMRQNGGQASTRTPVNDRAQTQISPLGSNALSKLRVVQADRSGGTI